MEIFNTSYCSGDSSGVFRYFVDADADVATIEWEASARTYPSLRFS
jgi:hypothetical protein